MKKSENTGQNKKHRELGLSIIPAIIMVLFVFFWQAAVDFFNVQPFILPGPITVFKAIYDERNLLLTHIPGNAGGFGRTWCSNFWE